MPKNKKAASESSDSDDGPEDRNPPPSKKTKGNSSVASKTEDEEPTWVLQKNKLVKVRQFKGKTYVDIREFYEKGGELLPGRKGISLNVEMWKKLLTYSKEIDETISKL